MPFDLKTGIVRILAADGTTTSGTGFILSEKGIIATCSHVIQPEKLQVRGYPRPEKVEVIFRANGQKATARLLPQAWRAAEACSRITRNMTRKEWGRFMDNPDADCLTCPAEGKFNRSSIWPWDRPKCQPCIGNLG